MPRQVAMTMMRPVARNGEKAIGQCVRIAISRKKERSPPLLGGTHSVLLLTAAAMLRYVKHRPLSDFGSAGMYVDDAFEGSSPRKLDQQEIFSVTGSLPEDIDS